MTRSRLFVAAAIVVAIAGFVPVSGAADSAQEPLGWHCWLPADLAENLDVVIAAVGPSTEAAVLNFSTDTPLAATNADGSPLKTDSVVTDAVLAESGGQLKVLTGLFELGNLHANYFVTPDDNIRLIPKTKTVIVFPEKVTIKDEGKLPATAVGTVSAKEPVYARLASAVRLAPYTRSLASAADSFRSERLPSASPADSLAVFVNKPGINFVESGTASKLRACIKVSDAQPIPVAVQSVKTIGDGSTELVLSLPRDLRPYLYDSANVSVILSDGSYFGEGKFDLLGIWVAIVSTILSVAFMYIVINKMVVKGSGGWLDWITPKGQKTSLSLFQIYLWTWIVLAGSIYVAVLTGEPLAVTTDVLALLGIAGLGSVTSRFISVTQDKNQPSAQPVFNDIFKTDDVFDLYKLQMFLFTVGTALYVAARIAFDKTFPVLDANLLLLLGISNGIYVASKAAGGASPFRMAEQLKSDLDVLGQAKQATDADVIRLDTAIRDADTAIRNAAANNQPTDKPEADKKMLEQQKAAADAKAKSLAEQIAKKTTEYKDAVSKI